MQQVTDLPAGVSSLLLAERPAPAKALVLFAGFVFCFACALVPLARDVNTHFAIFSKMHRWTAQACIFLVGNAVVVVFPAKYVS